MARESCKRRRSPSASIWGEATLKTLRVVCKHYRVPTPPRWSARSVVVALGRLGGWEPRRDREQGFPGGGLDAGQHDGADIGRLCTQGRLMLRCSISEAGQVDVGVGVDQRHDSKVRQGAHETLIRDLRN